jgi:hypothetical protein
VGVLVVEEISSDSQKVTNMNKDHGSMCGILSIVRGVGGKGKGRGREEEFQTPKGG